MKRNGFISPGDGEKKAAFASSSPPPTRLTAVASPSFATTCASAAQNNGCVNSPSNPQGGRPSVGRRCVARITSATGPQQPSQQHHHSHNLSSNTTHTHHAPQHSHHLSIPGMGRNFKSILKRNSFCNQTTGSSSSSCSSSGEDNKDVAGGGGGDGSDDGDKSVSNDASSSCSNQTTPFLCGGDFTGRRFSDKHFLDRLARDATAIAWFPLNPYYIKNHTSNLPPINPKFEDEHDLPISHHHHSRCRRHRRRTTTTTARRGSALRGKVRAATFDNQGLRSEDDESMMSDMDLLTPTAGKGGAFGLVHHHHLPKKVSCSDEFLFGRPGDGCVNDLAIRTALQQRGRLNYCHEPLSLLRKIYIPCETKSKSEKKILHSNKGYGCRRCKWFTSRTFDGAFLHLEEVHGGSNRPCHGLQELLVLLGWSHVPSTQQQSGSSEYLALDDARSALIPLATETVTYILWKSIPDIRVNPAGIAEDDVIPDDEVVIPSPSPSQVPTKCFVCWSRVICGRKLPIKPACTNRKSTPLQLRSSHPYFRPLAVNAVYHILIRLPPLIQLCAQGDDQSLFVHLSLCRWAMYLLSNHLTDDGVVLPLKMDGNDGDDGGDIGEQLFLYPAARSIYNQGEQITWTYTGPISPVGQRRRVSPTPTPALARYVPYVGLIERLKRMVYTVVEERLIEGDRLRILERAQRIKSERCYGIKLRGRQQRCLFAYGNIFTLISPGCEEQIWLTPGATTSQPGAGGLLNPPTSTTARGSSLPPPKLRSPGTTTNKKVQDQQQSPSTTGADSLTTRLLDF